MNVGWGGGHIVVNVLYTVHAVHIWANSAPKVCALGVDRLISLVGGLEGQPSIQAGNRTDVTVHWEMNLKIHGPAPCRVGYDPTTSRLHDGCSTIWATGPMHSPQTCHRHSSANNHVIISYLLLVCCSICAINGTQPAKCSACVELSMNVGCVVRV